jgi:hypothetical protein
MIFSRVHFHSVSENFVWVWSRKPEQIFLCSNVFIHYRILLIIRHFICQLWYNVGQVNATKEDSGIVLKSPVLPNIKKNISLKESNTQIAIHNSKFKMHQQHWAVNEDVCIMFCHYVKSQRYALIKI